MTDEEDTPRSRIIPIEHPERLMARLRGWDPVVDPFGTGLLRSFQCDTFSSFEPFTPPFTDAGYIRPQMLDNALFGYYPGNTVSQSEQENISAENVPRQPQLYDLSLVSASGVTGYIKSVLSSEDRPAAEQDDNQTMDTVDLNATQGTTQEVSRDSTDKITGRDTKYVDAKQDSLVLEKLEETISETSDAGSKIDKNNDFSGQDQSRQDNYVINIGKDAVESGKRKESITGDPGQTNTTDDMFDPMRVDLNSTHGTTHEVSQDSTDKIAGRDTKYVDAKQDSLVLEKLKETISETSDAGSKIDKINGFSGQGQSMQDNDVINIGKDAVESGKRKESITGDPGQTNTTDDMFDPIGVIPTPTGLHSLQANTYEVLIDA